MGKAHPKITMVPNTLKDESKKIERRKPQKISVTSTKKWDYPIQSLSP